MTALIRRVQISIEFGSIGRTLVAVATALHHEPQVVFAGEVDRRDDIVGRLGGHGIGARPGRPSIDPAKRLCQADFVAEVIGILSSSKIRAQRGLDGASRHAASGDCTLTSRPPTSRLSRSQLASEGHAGSPGRTRDTGRDAATARAGAKIRDDRPGRSGVAAAVRNRCLLFILPSSPEAHARPPGGKRRLLLTLRAGNGRELASLRTTAMEFKLRHFPMTPAAKAGGAPSHPAGRRAGLNRRRSTWLGRPSTISSAIASPLAGALRIPQTL